MSPEALEPTPLGWGVRIVTLLAVTVPIAGLVAAGMLMWGYGFNWIELGLLIGMYIATALGITVGYHRYFTHRSFETVPAVQFLLAVLGSMAFQGPMLTWVAVHRRHHQHSDQSDDPHSPHAHGGGILGLLKGLWHAHLGWMFKPPGFNIGSYVKDFDQRPWLKTVSHLFPLWVALGLLLPTGLGWLLIGGWLGAVLGLLWGGVIRIFLVHHVTWSINSICHLWGTQPYKGRDESRNNLLFGILGLGEGFHNNHHAFPTSARHGLKWWQVDVSYLVIRLLGWLGLAWKIRLPSEAALKAASAS
ncbi:MAG: acyl-CoA desaturase [Gemmatales bacterium]|nr:acyl-CoA desaturase [Gemmatales bacterium]MDW8386184.1 acyl-CoA desaturase [Gemmatales bacterium]